MADSPSTHAGGTKGESAGTSQGPRTDQGLRTTEQGRCGQESLSRAPARIAGMFDSIAAHYDLLNHLLSGGIDRRWRRRAIASLDLTGTERVLDLCTGTADLAIGALTAQPPAARIVGIDFAAAMLLMGEAKLRARRMNGRVALVRGDVTRIPARDRSVDAVTIGFGIRNVENLRAVCREVHRVLRPGGRFAILEFSIPASPVFRVPYLWYFTRALPRIGRAISRDARAYDYLPASVEAFSSPAELAAILQENEFVEVEAVPLTFGIVFLYTGRRGHM
jgi:demethylmenaquinone methyltransferase / 2-methoxy-6-polyprenyl-1,4-benzoquinol methylase